MSVPLFLKKTGLFMAKNSPIIMTVVSSAGLIGTVTLAIVATPKAVLIIDGLKEEYEPDKVPKLELVKQVAPVYIPTAILGGITLACIIGAAKVNHKRNVVLASLYSASEVALKEYQHKVIQKLGEKKEEEVRDDIARDRIERKPLSSSQVFVTSGDTMIFDSQSGRYFKGDIEKIRRFEIDINREVIADMWCSLNEFYYRIGLPSIPLGEDTGWDVDHRLEIRFSAHVADNDQPCLVLDYKVNPRRYPF